MLEKNSVAESSRYKISRWRAEFADQATERVFRGESADLDCRHGGRNLLILSLAFAFFIVGDLEVFNDDVGLLVSAATRIVVLIAGIVAFLILRKYRSAIVLDVVILGYAAISCMALVAQLENYIFVSTQPPNVFDVQMAFIIGTMITYVLLANPLRFQLAICLILIFSFGVLLFCCLTSANERLPFAIAYMVLVNAIGIATSMRLHEMRRVSWAGLREEREAKRQLEDENRERRVLEVELRKLATTDPLTDVANRRHFLALATAEIERINRYHRPMAIMVMDLDHFKKVNDTLGHAAGDEALKAAVAAIKLALRQSDVLGRVGGEEFAVLLPETDRKAAMGVADRIREGVEKAEPEWDGKKFSITVSIGVAESATKGQSLDDLMAHADFAMYEAKNQGRNRVVAYR